jgi:E3 ubiquitin-protein ligase BAH
MFFLNTHAVCDGTFFPSLLQEMSTVVECFNQRARKLLEMHLSSGFKKYVLWFFGNSYRSHGSLIQEGKDLVTYAIINSIAMRKILKKYDKASAISLENLYLRLKS